MTNLLLLQYPTIQTAKLPCAIEVLFFDSWRFDHRGLLLVESFFLLLLVWVDVGVSGFLIYVLHFTGYKFVH